MAKSSANAPDVSIGDLDFRLDQESPAILQRPPMRHWVRSPFTGRSDITGRPGSQNFYPDLMRWEMTDFAGEGQVVLHGGDSGSVQRFYASEGLNARVPGQLSLNKSTLAQQPQATTSSATTEGNAMVNEVGTYTVVNTTDARINLVNDIIRTANHAAGAVAAQANFHLYKEAQQLTTINGSVLVELIEPTKVSGTTLQMRRNSFARTANLASLTAGSTYEVQFFLHDGGTAAGEDAVIAIRDYTDPQNPTVVTNKAVSFTNTSAPSAATATLTFVPKSGHNYRAAVRRTAIFGGSVNSYLVVDSIQYGLTVAPTVVECYVYNETDTTVTATKTVTVSSTATALLCSIPFVGVAAKNYRYKVKSISGPQRPVLDKVEAFVGAAANFTFDALELGQGGKVWLVGSRSATDAQTWTYDFVNEDWDVQQAINSTATAGETCYALAHTDQFEYALMSGGRVFRFDTAADATHTAVVTDAVSIAVAQDRLFVLREGTSTGLVVETYGLDTGAPAAMLATTTIGTAKPFIESGLRQRMCGTPTGARFFVNYSDVHTVVYEVDSSGTVLTYRQVGILDPGAKATAIAYSAGHTFITGQFIAEVEEAPVSALWVIEPNGGPRRIGEFRDGNVNAPVFIQPYQNDVWIIQGDRMWRYSLTTGGLYLEYQMTPTTQANARALAVLRGHTFAVYSNEGVFVTGSLAQYRQASVTNGNTYTSSTYDYDLPGVLKMLDSLQVLTDQLPSATSIQVEIQKDQSGTWDIVGSESAGSKHFFRISGTSIVPTFQTLQVRVTLSSATGVNTPTVKGIVASAWTAEEEEFIDLVLRIDHEDSSDHPAGHQRDATSISQQLWSLKKALLPVTFTDHYDSISYLVRIEDMDDQRDNDRGEGRANVRLRVLK